MSLSTVLEVAIGLSFVFFVLSLVCSGVNEFLASVLRLRTKTLRKGLAELLGTKDEADKLFAHAAIRSLYRGKRHPSYIPTEKFTLAVLDGWLGDAAIGPSASPEKVTEALGKIPNDALRETLQLLWKDANHDIAVFRLHIEGWFNDTMQRVSGWYRRQTQYILLALGIALAVVLNVNTVTLAQRLWTDAPFRAAVAEQAKTVEPAGEAPGDLQAAIERIEEAYSRVDRLNLPMGWSGSVRPSPWYSAIPGWLLTGMALAMGAPFWFDLLNKASGLRSAGTRPAPARPSQAADEPTPPKPGTDASATGTA